MHLKFGGFHSGPNDGCLLGFYIVYCALFLCFGEPYCLCDEGDKQAGTELEHGTFGHPQVWKVGMG